MYAKNLFSQLNNLINPKCISFLEILTNNEILYKATSQKDHLNNIYNDTIDAIKRTISN